MAAGKKLTPTDIHHRFKHHAPKSEAVGVAHGLIRTHAELFAKIINHYVPPGREASLSMKALEEAMFWANAGIARNQGEIATWELVAKESSLRASACGGNLFDDLSGKAYVMQGDRLYEASFDSSFATHNWLPLEEAAPEIREALLKLRG